MVFDNNYNYSFKKLFGLSCDIEFAEYLKKQMETSGEEVVKIDNAKSGMTMKDVERYIEEKTQELFDYIDVTSNLKFKENDKKINGYIKLYKDLKEVYLTVKNVGVLPQDVKAENNSVKMGYNGQSTTSTKAINQRAWLRLASVLYYYGVKNAFIIEKGTYEDYLLSGLTKSQIQKIHDDERRQIEDKFGKVGLFCLYSKYGLTFRDTQYGNYDKADQKKVLRGGVKPLKDKKEFNEIQRDKTNKRLHSYVMHVGVSETDYSAENFERECANVAPFVKAGEATAKVVNAFGEKKVELGENKNQTLAKLGREYYLAKAKKEYEGKKLESVNKFNDKDTEEEQVQM